jgi:hypothetical protein
VSFSVELSTIEKGAILIAFSQYAGEEEMCVYS